MPEETRPPLSLDEVRHVARLARLKLADDRLEDLRGDLASILDHIDHLAALDLEGVEPMSHPNELTNRLDEDEVGAALPVEVLLDLAPAVEDRYLAVPKVLDGDGS